MLKRPLLDGLGVLVILAGGLTAGSVALMAGTANAVGCGTAIPAGSSCTMTGTVTLTAGTLTLTSPSSLTWAAALTGNDLSLADTVSAARQYTVTHPTGPGPAGAAPRSPTTSTNGTDPFRN